jgi:hypothetical protein
MMISVQFPELSFHFVYKKKHLSDGVKVAFYNSWRVKVVFWRYVQDSCKIGTPGRWGSGI